MKNFILLFILLISQIAYSQDTNLFNPNPITYQEFLDITLDGKTIAQIEATNGQETEMKALFGKTMGALHSTDPYTPWSSYGNENISIEFENYAMDGNYNLQGFSLDSQSAVMIIKGISVQIGDNIIKLGRKILLNTKADGCKGIIFCPTTSAGQFGDLFIVIDFDQVTKLITEIEFFVPT